MSKWCKEHDYLFWIHANHSTDEDIWCYSDNKECDRENLKEYELPDLSIGQMIEFLDEHKWKKNIVITKGGPYEIVKLPGQEHLPDKTKRAWYVAELTKEGLVFGGYGSRILADALWEACKEVLSD